VRLADAAVEAGSAIQFRIDNALTGLQAPPLARRPPRSFRDP
jgi:hypothetical protein